MKLVFARREYRFTGLGLVVYLLLMGLLCSLGIWQLGRAEQKRQFLLQQQAGQTLQRLNLNQQTVIDIDAVRCQDALVTGFYDTAHQFLIDNQVLDGKIGYLVLTPLKIKGQDQAVLVNRGWIALGQDRAVLPDINFVSAEQQVEGRINRFPTVGIKLKGADIPTESWPSVVQVVDSKVLSTKLGYAVQDFQIELASDAAHGYKRQWQHSTMIPPEKHLAYAVQWFGLALTLTGLFIWISSRKPSEHTA